MEKELEREEKVGGVDELKEKKIYIYIYVCVEKKDKWIYM